jgi:POT family proton-dependent oligopeptide transporter
LVNKKMRRLTSMFWGFVIASLGVYAAGSSMSISICLAGIACFSVGEMLCSPKMNEYLGVIAPADQKALYMGYANIPMALGWGYGSFVGGQMYERAGEKAGLALRYMSEVLMVKELPERTQAFSQLMEMLGQNSAQVTQLLWDKYDPSCVWTPFALAGLIAGVALFVFNRLAKNWRDVNA